VGGTGGEAYLVRTSTRSLLYDSGFAHAAPAMVAEIAALLAKRPLNYLFCSHSHYDHASGSVWVKERWPDTVILGSAHAARVLQRSGARKTIRALNEEAAKALSSDVFDYSPLDRLGIDRIVGEGDRIDLGSVKLEVIEAPGHTQCSLMLWCAEERLLFGSESIGVMQTEDMVMPAYLTGYAEALATIDKACALAPKHILLNHRHVISGDEVARYLKNARYWAKEIAHIVWEGASVGKSKEELAATLKNLFYYDEFRAFQPEAAFDLNNGYLIDQLLSCVPAVDSSAKV
jgi:glyoxylase-like metal-dependent hydrolase (beta-lactamase superfamily II)